MNIKMLNIFSTIGIILLLFVASVSICAELKDSRNMLLCKSNLAELHKITVRYTNDNDGYIMPAVDTTPNRWKFWYKFNLRYTDNAAIYYCPEKKEVKLLKIYEKGIKDPLEPVTFSENAQSYGLNHFASKRIDKKNKNNYKGQKLNSLSNPDYMVLFGDSNMPYLRPTTACWLKDYAPRHEENSSNYIMVDGHIENHNKKSLGIYNKIDGWNLDVKRWTGKD